MINKGADVLNDLFPDALPYHKDWPCMEDMSDNGQADSQPLETDGVPLGIGWIGESPTTVQDDVDSVMEERMVKEGVRVLSAPVIAPEGNPGQWAEPEPGPRTEPEPIGASASTDQTVPTDMQWFQPSSIRTISEDGATLLSFEESPQSRTRQQSAALPTLHQEVESQMDVVSIEKVVACIGTLVEQITWSQKENYPYLHRFLIVMLVAACHPLQPYCSLFSSMVRFCDSTKVEITDIAEVLEGKKKPEEVLEFFRFMPMKTQLFAEMWSKYKERKGPQHQGEGKGPASDGPPQRRKVHSGAPGDAQAAVHVSPGAGLLRAELALEHKKAPKFETVTAALRACIAKYTENPAAKHYFRPLNVDKGHKPKLLYRFSSQGVEDIVCAWDYFSKADKHSQPAG